ncbi:cupin domain-containing protein [Teichococcus aestuarii]|nr:cupin domain-containing protein [Pseudoroseomonas aestuarii]
MRDRPPNAAIMAEARRLMAEDPDGDLYRVAELLAELGHYGPDGKPYPARTIMNLLDDDLRRRRDDLPRQRNRPATASYNQWLQREGHRFVITGGGEDRDGADGNARQADSARGPTFGHLSEGGPRPAPGEETFLDLLTAPGGARVERILSRGAASAPDFWYEQACDEFVLVISGGAVLAFEDGSERRLEAGDYAILPAFCRHRVAWTDSAGETVWLAVHMPPAATSQV